MAIPIHLQQFKAAGIYRVVFDKSTIVNYDTELLRLVVGYSEQGPFNTPVYVKDPQTFTALFGGINKKLEKRGIYFHRLALQMLQVSPCLVLNLKKFSGETVDGATISTEFNPTSEPLSTVKLNVEDIYDTTRFWTLDADKLINLRDVDGNIMDQYINIATTNTKKTSATLFIRKASGLKVSGFNITVNDWYSDKPQEMPEFLEKYKNSLISDFFAEIYVFKGKFTAKQVLASDTLKNYFIVETMNDGSYELKLRDKVFNAFGDAVDTLDTLYADETSNALGHYVGCLIPEFKTKNNSYACLDVAFNQDIDIHNMMMSFNTDLLYEYEDCAIDISGRINIPTADALASGNVINDTLSLDSLFDGTATTTVLGNINAKVVTDNLKIKSSVLDDNNMPKIDFVANRKSINGTLYVKSVSEENIVLVQVNDNPEGEAAKSVTIQYGPGTDTRKEAEDKFGVVFKNAEGYELAKGQGTSWPEDNAFTEEGHYIDGPEKIITSIVSIEPSGDDATYTDLDKNLRVSMTDVSYETVSNYNDDNSVYGSSITFVDYVEDNWEWNEQFELTDGIKQPALVCNSEYYDRSLLAILHEGDCMIADDGKVDYNEDGDAENDVDNFHDVVYVQDMGTKYDADGKFVAHYVLFSGEPLRYEHSADGKTNKYLVRVDAPLNQEIGTMKPYYFEGYTYNMQRPNGTTMYDKLQWQKNILSVLTEYKGLRTGLLNKSEIDYRYVIDTFQSFPDASIKKELSFLCKEKQSAFCIANFPSVQTFTKCPYASFTDSKGVFNVDYVVKGCNKKKAASISFSLPDDSEGASFIAFYTPLKFSDGYLDTIVPSAGLVSNLFIQKYMTRQPYYIVAGPNYGRVNASGMIGPDYKYSMDELQIIEPFGVNCMVYRPNFGTFINANQTAKQIPLSALSKVHVRELVIYLMDEIEKVLQAYQWEFNNSRTREAILGRANDICARVMSNGGLQAYLNIMDESNNTPEIIDNEMAVLSTHIEPGQGCGKMVHELTLYRTGQMLSTINESR